MTKEEIKSIIESSQTKQMTILQDTINVLAPLNSDQRTFLTGKQIKEIMHWSNKQLRGRVEALAPYGLFKDGHTYLIPINGFLLYIDSLTELKDVSSYITWK